MSKLKTLNRLLQRTGFELLHYNNSTNGLLRRRAIFEKYNVDLIIDVGANTGIFGEETRAIGYSGDIVSFEPLHDAYAVLEKKTAKDPRWTAHHFALGSEKSIQQINISANSHSSSLLNILDRHTEAESSASYVGKQEIQVDTLDAVFPDFAAAKKEIFLKIDTQGFEMHVLKGAEKSLPRINTIQLEMSLQPLYAGQALYHELMNFLHLHGYYLIDIEPGFTDEKSGVLLQFDGIFRREPA